MAMKFMAATAFIGLGAGSSQLLAAGRALWPTLVAAAADPRKQAAVQEFLQEASGGSPGASSPARISQGITIGTQGLQHVIERHTVGGMKNAGKSLFAEGEDVIALIKSAEGTAGVLQPNGRFQRIVDAGRSIGTDRATGMTTSTYTVITDKADNLVTAFPGKP
jgi:hypothetical protein